MLTSQTPGPFLLSLVTIVSLSLLASACSISGEISRTGESLVETSLEETSPEETAPKETSPETTATTKTPDFRSTGDAEATADVMIEGDALPLSGQDANDPAIGLVAPELTGSDIAGEALSITNDGRPKVIYFVTHWCPHCQREVPVLTELISAGKQPEGLDIYAISTAADANRGNFPPNKWLIEVGFPAPTMLDSETNDAFSSFGGGGFPYAVYLDANHQVIARTFGELGEDEIVLMWERTAG